MPRLPSIIPGEARPKGGGGGGGGSPTGGLDRVKRHLARVDGDRTPNSEEDGIYVIGVSD